VSFFEFINITFNNNRALYGGAVLANNCSNISLTGNSVLLFINNEATQSGGARYFDFYCNFTIKGNANVTFENNKALHGGAVCFNNNAKQIFKENSVALFYRNYATVSGGAVCILNNSNITFKEYVTIKFTNNSAQYGGAIFLDTTAVMVNISDKNSVSSINNIAKILSNSVYLDVSEWCNASCLTNRMVGINNELIATPPNELKLYDPALCIDDDNDTQCHKYYVQYIMLGREIVIPVCVLDYYNQSNDSIQFLVENEMKPNYFTSGQEQILMSCDAFQGVSIMGNQHLLQSTNFSINITLNVDHNADWKQISVTLIVELSPCYPGFWQYPNRKNVNVTIVMILYFVLVVIQLSREVIGLVM